MTDADKVARFEDLRVMGYADLVIVLAFGCGIALGVLMVFKSVVWAAGSFAVLPLLMFAFQRNLLFYRGKIE